MKRLTLPCSFAMIDGMELVFDRLQTPIGELLIAASFKGICRISFPVELSGKWFPWFDRHFSEIPRMGEHPLIESLDKELGEYLLRERTRFEVPMDLRGTPFQVRIWQRLLKIPYGSSITYGELAHEIGIPGGSRAIGSAAAANPVPILVPCHRVVGKGGNLIGFGGGIALKEKLLELEGARIPFGDNLAAEN